MGQTHMNNTSRDSSNNSSTDDYKEIRHVLTCIIISVELLLTLVAIYAVHSLVRKDNVAPIYVINLLISDLIQLCCMVIWETGAAGSVSGLVYFFSLMASVGFMVCIAMERYLVIAWPLWYRRKRTIKISLGVCVVVWAVPLVCILLVYFRKELKRTVYGVFLLLPFPLLIFFLAGTIKALSAAISVRAGEKRRIVGLLVLVLLIYTLLFLPGIVLFLADNTRSRNFSSVSYIFFKLSPLADLFLYVFLRKGAVNKVLACLCRCRDLSSSQPSSSMNGDNPDTVISA